MRITSNFLKERIGLINNLYGKNYSLSHVKTGKGNVYGINKPNGSLLSKNYYSPSELNCFINGIISMDNELSIHNE